MSKSELFPDISDINFCAKDPDTLTQEVISRYELLTGRTLARSDPVRLFLNAIILEFIQQRNAIDFAAKMNLLAYAQGDYLDHIGALLGVKRLGASSSSCTVAFTLSAPLNHSIDIPIGTRITPDGKVFFATTELIRILAGQTESLCVCSCTEPGTIGNDFAAGSISKIVDPFPYELKVENLDVSGDGTDQESDEAFRERIHIAPESFTTAGSAKGYEYYALSADSNILDVSVVTPPKIAPGNVNIYVLMTGGAAPSDKTLANVLAACNGDDVRPDTDYVHALRPEQVSYSVNVKYWIDSENSARSETIQAQVSEAVSEWVKWQGMKLGRDINPSRLSHDIVAAGAKRCEIISPTYTALKKSQCAKCQAPYNIFFQGLE